MNSCRILVITTWNYDDALIQSHTLPYLKIIHELNHSAELFLVTQEKDTAYLKNTLRAEINHDLSRYHIHFRPQKYYRFGLLKLITSVFQFIQLWWFVISKKITHVHCFCTPAGGIGYLLSVLTKRKLILDSYEPHAEAMIENGTWTQGSLAFKLLWWLEKKQSVRATYRIGIATGMIDYARDKWGVNIQQVGLKPCCVNLEQFQFDKNFHNAFRDEHGWNNKIVCVYAGKFGGIYLEQEVFDFFKAAFDFWGNQFRVLLLTGLTPEAVKKYCDRSELPLSLFYINKVPFEKMPQYLSVADFGFTPVKPVPSKRYCSPIKDGEYWALGLPVVITDHISDDSEIIRKHNAGAVLSTLDKESYKEAIGKMDILLKGDRECLKKRIRKLAETYRSYTIAYQEYKNVYQASCP